MTVEAAASWMRLDMPGKDVCLLERRVDGWKLQGVSTSETADGDANLRYLVLCDPQWRTTRAEVQGLLAGRLIDLAIDRHESGWALNGSDAGLGHLTDLDLGFSPATNLLPIRRVRLPEKQPVPLPAAWLDVDAGTLTELAQTYERRGNTSFWYEAPATGYAGLLEVAPSGFILSYPGLFEERLAASPLEVPETGAPCPGA